MPRMNTRSSTPRKPAKASTPALLPLRLRGAHAVASAALRAPSPAKRRKSAPSVKPTQGAKTSFVRSLPRSLPASEVVKMGAARGLVFSKAYVHNIRSAANKAARRLKGFYNPRASTSKHDVKQFETLVLALGPARARKLLDKIEGALTIGADRA